MLFRSLAETDCFCGAHKLKYSMLCKRCYFELEGNIRERAFRVMSMGIFARAAYELPRVDPAFWDVYPLLVRDCLNWLKEHTNRLEGRKVENITTDIAA